MEKFDVSEFVKNLESRDKDNEMLPNAAGTVLQGSYAVGGYVDSSVFIGVDLANSGLIATDSGVSLSKPVEKEDFLFSCFSPGKIVSERLLIKYKNEEEMKQNTLALKLGYELCYSGREGDTDNYYAIYHRGESMSTYALIKNGETVEKED